MAARPRASQTTQRESVRENETSQNAGARATEGSLVAGQARPPEIRRKDTIYLGGVVGVGVGAADGGGEGAGLRGAGSASSACCSGRAPMAPMCECQRVNPQIGASAQQRGGGR